MTKELSFFQCVTCKTRLFCGYVCHKCGSDNAEDCDEAVQQVQPENDDLTAAYLAGYHKGKEVQPVQPTAQYELVCAANGFQNGYPCISMLDPAMVLPFGAALYVQVGSKTVQPKETK